MTEKVVGTTFVQQPNIEDLQGEYIESSKTSRGMSELRTRAQLIRDPENPYDPTAVGVYVRDKFGAQHRIGYLARTSALKPKITGFETINLTIINYKPIGLNNSYILTGEPEESNFTLY